MVGMAGDFDNVPGILKSFDADTGKLQWTFYSTPPPGDSEPKSGGATGGQMWNTGTYDPELNLVDVGTGNPTPVLNGDARPGDNLWTCSIVALDPEAGKLVWGFQGKPRKLVMQPSRNGYFFVLDRTNGKSLLTKPFAAVNWAKGIDRLGRPIPDPPKEPTRDGTLRAPDEAGAINFRPPNSDPETGLLIVSAHDGYGIYFFKPEHRPYGSAGADYNSRQVVFRAIDYKTGKFVWDHPIGENSGTRQMCSPLRQV
jgi:alcohol dehydrogenase (cytochrome c)